MCTEVVSLIQQNEVSEGQKLNYQHLFWTQNLHSVPISPNQWHTYSYVKSLLNAIVFWRRNRTERYNIKGVYDKCNYNCVMYVKNVKPIFPYMQKMNTCHVQTQNTYLQLYIPLILYIYHASSKKIKFNIVKNIETDNIEKTYNM